MITDAAAQPNRLLTSHDDMSPMSQRGRQTRPDITTVTMRTSLSQPPAVEVRVSAGADRLGKVGERGRGCRGR